MFNLNAVLFLVLMVQNNQYWDLKSILGVGIKGVSILEGT